MFNVIKKKVDRVITSLFDIIFKLAKCLPHAFNRILLKSVGILYCISEIGPNSILRKYLLLIRNWLAR